MLTQNELKILASFYASDFFPILKKVIGERIEIIKEGKNKRESEFETIYQLGNSDGRQEELFELLRTLEGYYKRYSK